MPDPLLSVIIATRNRPIKLGRLLTDLAGQSLPADRFEVIICDDGSRTPATDIPVPAPLHDRLLRLRLEGNGPATARNRGLERSSAPLVLFLNDDVRADPELLATHVALHRHNPGAFAFVGTFVFTEAARLAPFTRLVEELGVFGTARFPTGIPLGPLAFCTGNLSARRSDLQAVDGFDPGFPAAAGEDLDLGYRLSRRRGVRLIHSHRPRVHHDHPHGLADWLDRWKLWGQAMRRLADKHADPLFWPGGIRNRNPARARQALARLIAQQAVVDEVMSTLDRLERGETPTRIRLNGLRRSFDLPTQAPALYRIGVHLSRFFIQKSFWETGETISRRANPDHPSRPGVSLCIPPP